MSKHSVWDREDVHPAWMIVNLLDAESRPCPFEFLGESCGAQKGERCQGSAGDDYTYIAPNGRTVRSMPAHMTRYSRVHIPSRPHSHANGDR